jgi:hypothetical protein
MLVADISLCRGLALILFNQLRDFFLGHRTLYFIVDGQYRSQSTASDTSYFIQGKKAVIGRLTTLNTEFWLKCFYDALSPAYMARSARADGNLILTYRCKAEQIVKSRDPVDCTQRNIHLCGNKSKCPFWQVVERTVYIMENWQNWAGVITMLIDDV